MQIIATGAGDYWGSCYGHPLDPRTYEHTDEIEAAIFICDEVSDQLRIIKTAIRQGNVRKIRHAFSQIHDLTAAPD